MGEGLDQFKKGVGTAVFFLLLPMLLYWQVTVGNQTMIPADNLFQWAPWESAVSQFHAEIPQNPLIGDLVIQNYAWKQFTRHSLQQGEIPLWNPYQFAGVPFLATGQHGMLYPFSWLFLLLPMSKAYGWFTVSQLWLAGVCLYIFGRFLQMRRISAMLAGVVYQGCGFLVVSSAVFPMIIAAAAWLPLLLGCVERVVSSWRLEMEDFRPSTFHPQSLPILWIACGVVALGLQILAGHIEITYYTLLIMAGYGVWRMVYNVSPFWKHHTSYAIRQISSLSLQLLSLVFLGILLGAVQLIPFYEVGQRNFREGSMSFAEVQNLAFPKRHVLTFLMPNFYGNPAEHSYVDVFSGQTTPFTQNASGQVNPRGAYSSDWGIKNYVEGAAYLGILPLFLAILGVSSLRSRRATEQGKISTLQSPSPYRQSHTLFFVGLATLSLAFMFGTPLYALLYYGLPFINQLHTPFRWVFPFSLCVAILAGFGADYLVHTREQVGDGNTTKKSPISRLQSPLFLWGQPSFITGLAGLAFWAGVAGLAGLYGTKLFFGRFSPLVETLFHNLALADETFANAQAFYSYEFRQIFLLGLMLVATGAVLRVSRCPIFVQKRPIWEFMAVTTLILDLFLAFFQFHAAVDPALLSYQPALMTWLQTQPGQWRLTSFDPHGQKPINANTPWLFNLQDVRGYDSIIPKQYTQYMAAIEPQNELPFNRIQPITNWESLNSPLLDVLGVKYVVTAESITLPKFRLAWQGEGLQVYENLAVAPRAYTLPQAATVVATDVLAALRQYDPRNFVVIGEEGGRLEIGGVAPNPQSLTSYTPAAITHYGYVEVVIETAVSDPSWLILNDSYAPGWKVYLRAPGEAEEEERPLDLYQVNGNFRGVLLPPGEWLVRFRYSPVSFQLGALGSVMGSIILLFTAGVWGWRRLVNPQAVLTNTRSIAKNSVAPMALSLFNKLIDFVYAAFYLRVLGPADSGSFATAIATAGLFEIFANFGLDILLIREVSQDRSKAAHYLVNSTILRLGAGVVASLPIVVLVLSSQLSNNPFSPAEITAMGLIMVGMLFSGMSKGVTGLFYVYEQAETPAAMTTATTILKVGLGVGALLLGYGFVGLSAVSILVNILTLLALLWLTRRLLRGRAVAGLGHWQVDWALQRQMVRLGFPLMLIHLLQTVFISIDIVLIKLLLSNGETVVGWYQSAYKWFNALQIVPSFFTLALFPIISREIKNGSEAAPRMYQMALKVMLLLALPTAVFTTFLAYTLTNILAGDEFLPHGAISLQLVIWSVPIGWLNSVTNYVLIALGLERIQPRAFAIGVGFNIITNLIFIPFFSYVAAAITTILSEIVLLLLFDYYLRQRMAGFNWWQFLWRPGVVTAVTLLLMYLGNQIHLVVALGVGLLVYPAGLWLLRVFGDDEKLILQQILPARLTSRLWFLRPAP